MFALMSTVKCGTLECHLMCDEKLMPLSWEISQLTNNPEDLKEEDLPCLF
jgi:hypothetical protein